MGRSGATAGRSWPASAAAAARLPEKVGGCCVVLGWARPAAGSCYYDSWRLQLRCLAAPSILRLQYAHTHTSSSPAARLYMFILDPSSPVAGGSLVPEFYSRGGILDTELGRLKKMFRIKIHKNLLWMDEYNKIILSLTLDLLW